MNTVKVTKYSRRLPELRTSLSLLQLGRVLMAQTEKGRDQSILAHTIIEIGKVDQRIEEIQEQIAMNELLHQASILVGNFNEYRAV
ncbi:hypothetical protein [Tellurirhabdus bombi]|uniref:hypothetical protein n=1 Tax=Tellurirhabdus bombi TaxID=2907205 RepID=UPI001F1B6AEE|nr:hypothetical protein [Tellurirhabdus bombi]